MAKQETDPIGALGHHLRYWITTVNWEARDSFLNRDVRGFEDDLEAPYRGEYIHAFRAAHTVLVGLKHIHRTIELLQERRGLDGEAGEIAGIVVQQCDALKGARDLLEHQEEYLAGVGRYPERVSDSTKLMTIAESAAGARRLIIFGNEYDLTAVLRSVLRLGWALDNAGL